jgi:hypothetical protein
LSLRGYRYGEVPLPKIPPVKGGTVIKEVKMKDVNRGEGFRLPVQVSLGCHVDGAAFPHPDLAHIPTTKAGVSKRFAAKPPVADPAMLAELKDFVQKWCEKFLVPLSPDSDLSFEKWIEDTPYPQVRKDELRRIRSEFDSIDEDRRWFKIKSFIKDECYPEYKHARPINSRSDHFKVYSGPIFKAIEKVVYENPHFIKHVPVSDRPAYIKNKLYSVGAKYLATDYTSFEALFTRELMQSCEFVMYNYMTQFLPCNKEFMRHCETVLAGRNECNFRGLKVTVDATRMSGEMCTSLGNGFSNLMFMEFMCYKLGSKLDGCVEGDDGIFSVVGEVPTKEDFEKLGLVIKLEVHDDLFSASFCGIVFDEHDCINVADPIRVLLTFGWTTFKYANARHATLMKLLKAKSLSYAHQYPGCPIIASLAAYGLRVTKNYELGKFLENNRNIDSWHYRKLMSFIKKPVPVLFPTMRTRMLMQMKFGVSVEQQLFVEKYLDSLDCLQELHVPWIEPNFNNDVRKYFENYVSSNVDPNWIILQKYSGFISEI